MTKFSVSEAIDERTGLSVLTVMLNGRECIQEEIPGSIAKSFAGFVSIFQDLRDVSGMLRAAYSALAPVDKGDDQSEIVLHYQKLPDAIRMSVKAHYFAAISLYGRCFVSSSRRGTVLSEKSHVSAPFRERHAEIMRLRHGLVAHAGGMFDDHKVIVAYLRDRPSFHVRAKISRLDFEDDRAVDVGFLELVEHVIEAVDKKQQELLQKLIVGQAREIVVSRQQGD